jgi:tRNA pseudouridine38-40 synthase
MSRYFIEVAYKGTRYSGFQIQENAITIQSEVEAALQTYYKQHIELTGSSRTDAGVHALQNFFHFDFEKEILDKHAYNMNAILPPDIVIKSIQKVANDAHCRFHATTREYKYYIYQQKNPFLEDRAWFYPYHLNINLLHQAASVMASYTDFTSFSKRNTQVKTFLCNIEKSEWYFKDGCWVYNVKANRFLRGMVRGLVGTMLKVARGAITIQQLHEILEAKDCTKADFTSPAHGLFLIAVNYPEQYFQ